MTVALIIAGSALVLVALIAFVVWAHQYTKAGPNEVLIISGRRGRGGGPGYRVVRGGGTYVRPFRERVQRLSLELMQFDVKTPDTYTMHGVPLALDGVAMVKIDGSDEGTRLELPIRRAAAGDLATALEDDGITAFLARDEEELAADVGRYLTAHGFLRFADEIDLRALEGPRAERLEADDIWTHGDEIAVHELEETR